MLAKQSNEHQTALYTHPLQDGMHRWLLLNVKAQEYGIPLHIRQPLHRVQVRRARSVLHFDAHRLGVVHASVDICLVTGASNGPGLHAARCQYPWHMYI